MIAAVGAVLSTVKVVLGPAAAALLPAVSARGDEQPRAVDYLQDIKPILVKHCTACHGVDAATRDLPDPTGAGTVPAAEVQRAALAALADRFAIIVPDAGAWAGA